MADIAFGFQAAPASDIHKSDQALYREVMADCALGQKLGYDAAWLLEHHFSDYYPTPSPLLFMAYIAAAFPDLSLGTSVLVLPWYHPLRLAEEIAMLNGMTRGTLHLGIGRGTAKMEYDAYNIDMNEARARFAECYRIVEKGLTGEPFTQARVEAHAVDDEIDDLAVELGPLGGAGDPSLLAVGEGHGHRVVDRWWRRWRAVSERERFEERVEAGIVSREDDSRRRRRPFDQGGDRAPHVAHVHQ